LALLFLGILTLEICKTLRLETLYNVTSYFSFKRSLQRLYGDKAVKKFFQQHISSKTKEKLQVVYSDVCGPI